MQKIEGLHKHTVLLNSEELNKAQEKAAKNGVPLTISGNVSAFLRYLVSQFLEGKKKRGD